MKRRVWLLLAGLITVASAAFARPQPHLSQPAGGILGGFDGLLQNVSVQKELNLSEQQIVKSKEIIREVRHNHGGDFEKLKEVPQAERRDKVRGLVEAVSRETLQKVVAILKPAQVRRLKEIELQERGLHAFADRDVEQALHLTDEQKTKIKKLGEGAGTAIQKISKESGNDYHIALKQIGAYRRELMREAMALLTPEQRKSWKELTGEPFEVQVPKPPGKEGGDEKKPLVEAGK
jgi:Spy/CpxP family protein refolding chaperone